MKIDFGADAGANVSSSALYVFKREIKSIALLRNYAVNSPEMFTGLVEEKGEVLSFHREAEGWRLKVKAHIVPEGVKLGDSIAVNGCCLSAVSIYPFGVELDVLEETRRVTNLKNVNFGSSVNLERSLRFDGRVGGHFLTGHVDGEGEILELQSKGADVLLRIKAPEAFARYLVYKGCVAIDGISLTVAEVEGLVLSIWLIPHTLAVTTLGERSPGDSVNMEFDLLAKYTENILAHQDR